MIEDEIPRMIFYDRTVIAISVYMGPEHRVGTHDLYSNDVVDSITPYGEDGGMGWTLWFKVVYTSGAERRVNGSYVLRVDYGV